MKGEESSTRRFSDVDKMTQVAEAVFFRNRSFKSFCHGNLFFTIFIFFIPDFEIPKRSKHLTMSTDTSREDTIHHIDTTRDSLDEIFWCPDSHEVVWFIFRKKWFEDIKDTIHVLFAFSDRKSTYRNSWSIK